MRQLFQARRLCVKSIGKCSSNAQCASHAKRRGCKSPAKEVIVGRSSSMTSIDKNSTVTARENNLNKTAAFRIFGARKSVRLFTMAIMARGARRIPVKNSINVSASRVKWGASAARAYIATVSISTSNSPETVAEPDFNHSRKAAQMTMAVKAADAHKA